METNQLKNGDRLPSEDELSKSVGVGRSTVREALRVLELMGLVETKRGKGTIVKENNIKSFNDKIQTSVNALGIDSYYVYELDRLLEPGLAQLVAQRATDADINELESILGNMKQSVDAGGGGKEESLAFHKAIYDIIKNPFLDIIFDLTKDVHQSDRETILSLTDRGNITYEEHYKIFEAIRSRDGAKAYKYMDRHLSKVGKTYDNINSFKKTDENKRDERTSGTGGILRD